MERAWEMGKWKMGWKQRIESYWFWFQFFLFSFSVLVTSHKKWIIWLHCLQNGKGCKGNAAICGELENLYFNLNRNEEHFAFHNACKQALLLASRVQGVKGSHMSIKQGQPRGNWAAVLATLECNPLPRLLGKTQGELAPNFQAGSLVWVWAQFWQGVPPAQTHKALLFSLRNSHKWGFQLFSTHDKHFAFTCGVVWYLLNCDTENSRI